jgi:hypothetical protein
MAVDGCLIKVEGKEYFADEKLRMHCREHVGPAIPAKAAHGFISVIIWRDIYKGTVLCRYKG